MPKFLKFMRYALLAMVFVHFGFTFSYAQDALIKGAAFWDKNEGWHRALDGAKWIAFTLIVVACLRYYESEQLGEHAAVPAGSKRAQTAKSRFGDLNAAGTAYLRWTRYILVVLVIGFYSLALVHGWTAYHEGGDFGDNNGIWHLVTDTANWGTLALGAFALVRCEERARRREAAN